MKGKLQSENGGVGEKYVHFGPRVMRVHNNHPGGGIAVWWIGDIANDDGDGKKRELRPRV